MTSFEGRDHSACRRGPSRPHALLTDSGLPTLAVLNGPLMAQAWFLDEPMTCKPSTSRSGSARHQPDLHIKARWQHRKFTAGYTFAALARSQPLQRANPGAPELVHGLLETPSSVLVSCCLLHGAATQWLPIDRTTFVVAEPWFVVGEEHLADKVAPTAHTGLLEDALQVLLHGG